MIGAAGDFFSRNELVKWCFSKMIDWILASKVEPIKWCTTPNSTSKMMENLPPEAIFLSKWPSLLLCNGSSNTVWSYYIFFERVSVLVRMHLLTVQRWSSTLFRTRMGFAVFVGIVCVWCVQSSSCGVGCMSGGHLACSVHSNGIGQCYSFTNSYM